MAPLLFGTIHCIVTDSIHSMRPTLFMLAWIMMVNITVRAVD